MKENETRQRRAGTGREHLSDASNPVSTTVGTLQNVIAATTYSSVGRANQNSGLFSLVSCSWGSRDCVRTQRYRGRWEAESEDRCWRFLSKMQNNKPSKAKQVLFTCCAERLYLKRQQFFFCFTSFSFFNSHLKIYKWKADSLRADCAIRHSSGLPMTRNLQESFK